MDEKSEIAAIREEYEKQLFDLRQLLEVSKSLNSTLDYHILIDSILYTIMGQMRVLKAGLFVKKGLDSRCFSFHRTYKGFEIDHSIDYSIADDHPAIKLFTRQYGCYTLWDLRQRLGAAREIECLAALGPSLIVPLKTKGEVNGIIVVGDKIGDEEFDVYEREYALNIASLASVAISNASLFEMTTTDMMTRLRMKHYFFRVLSERMESCANARRPLSVAMVDIDRFKLFNDEHGHSCGDAVLVHVARILQSCVRSIDIAARYGGEEFCVLLYDTDAEKARNVAERIRSAIASTPAEYEGGSYRVTVSLGVAHFDPSRDLAGSVLIDRADKALYISKQSGRNKVTIAE